MSELTATTARRILIVDDNRDSAMSLAMLLTINLLQAWARGKNGK